jgi:hypothetical protein
MCTLQSQVVYLRQKEHKIGEGIVRGVSFMRSMFDSRHTIGIGEISAKRQVYKDPKRTYDYYCRYTHTMNYRRVVKKGS